MTHRPSTPLRPLAHAALAFRCEVTAHDLSGSREVILAYYRATSPRLAVRWMRAEAQHLARLLAPAPTAPHLRSVLLVAAGPTCPRPDADLLAWASSDAEHERALRILRAGKNYLLMVEDYDARYALRVYPLPTQSPAPAGRRTHAPAGAGRHRKSRRWRFTS
ncbi:hypothetical protein ACIO53_41270 [Streptomyces sp. NPDC087305]|uniref:hypothetical protein n=1 Tax=Streptomyces sp. NPDC087305 TaxID=3365781 RepID=UPI003818B89B